MQVNFEVGDWVLVKATAVMGYDQNKNRQVFTTPLNPTVKMQVVGGVHRKLGKYQPAHGHSDSWAGGGEYDPPCLHITGTVLLIQCRARFLGKIIDARPEDLEKLNAKPN